MPERTEAEGLLGLDDAVDVLAPSIVGVLGRRRAFARGAGDPHVPVRVCRAPRRSPVAAGGRSPARRGARRPSLALHARASTFFAWFRNARPAFARLGAGLSARPVSSRRPPCHLCSASDASMRWISVTSASGRHGLVTNASHPACARPFGVPGQRMPRERHDRDVAGSARRPSTGASLPIRPSAAAPDPSG